MAKSTDAEMRNAVSKLAITRGVVAVLFGILALVWPGMTLVTLGVLLALWLLISGATGLVSSVLSRRTTPHWVLRMLVGLLQLGVGAYLVQRPALSVATIVALVAIALIAEGVVDVIAAFIDNNQEHRVLAVITGFLGVLAGVVIWRYPVSASLAFVWVVGLYALISGCFTIAAGVELEK